MKVLILSCNTGGGHNSAARAIRQSFAADGVPCDIVDALSFASRLRENVVCKGHVFAYRHLPALYGSAYRFVEDHPPKKNHKSGVYRSNVSYADRIGAFLVQNGYDTVICVHIFAANAMTKILREHPGLVRCYLVATDYTCSPGVSDTELDGYFIPHADLDAEFSAAGLPTQKLHATGIPVGSEFYAHEPRKTVCRNLGLDDRKRTVLLMSGSMGCGPMKELAEGCLAELPADCQLVALCGDNKKLRAELGEIHSEKLRVVGYTKQISQYMDAAELIVTKAGGLSSTEAAAKNLPILFVDAVPGCESRNLDFFVRHGWADTAAGTDALIECISDYLETPEKCERLSSRLKTDFSQIAANALKEVVLKQAAL